MGKLTAFAVLEGVSPQKAFVAGRCEIVAYGEHALPGRVFLAFRLGEVAACVALDDDALPAGRGRLGDRAHQLAVRVETENRNGLCVVTSINICSGSPSASGAWSEHRQHWQLHGSARDWYAAISVAAMALDTRSTLPAPMSDRPHANRTVEVEIVGEIGQGQMTAEKVLARMGSPDRVPGNLVITINSDGGGFDDGRRIYEALANWPCAVYANIRKAHSAAALIALGADVRRITPDGSMLLHPMSVEFKDGDRYSTTDLMALSRRMLDNTKEMINIVALATGVDTAIAEQWCATETAFDAGAAFDCGLVHDVRADDVPATPRPLRVKTAPINGPFLPVRSSVVGVR